MFITDEIMQATAYMMKAADNEEYYIERQEHYDLCANSKGEWLGCGHYCFDLDNNIMYFKFWHQERWIEGKIFDYSMDYGRTWWSKIGEK